MLPYARFEEFADAVTGTCESTHQPNGARRIPHAFYRSLVLRGWSLNIPCLVFGAPCHLIKYACSSGHISRTTRAAWGRHTSRREWSARRGLRRSPSFPISPFFVCNLPLGSLLLFLATTSVATLCHARSSLTGAFTGDATPPRRRTRLWGSHNLVPRRTGRGTTQIR